MTPVLYESRTHTATSYTATRCAATRELTHESREAPARRCRRLGRRGVVLEREPVVGVAVVDLVEHVEVCDVLGPIHREALVQINLGR